MRALSGTWLALIVGTFVGAGCGEVPAAAAKKSGKQQAARATLMVDDRPKLPQVTQAEYASLDAAWADVEKLSSDPTGGQKLLRIERWLGLQGDKIAPELAAKINDPSAGLATRLTACRVLARLGPVATPTLLGAIGGEPKQLRLKAIESLGRVEPPSDEIVKRLLALVDDQDFATRKAALGGLKDVGVPAKQAVDKLQTILNDPQEDETIRSLAKAALKAVDPRTGLMKAE
jgi:HEAT repeat protein